MSSSRLRNFCILVEINAYRKRGELKIRTDELQEKMRCKTETWIMIRAYESETRRIKESVNELNEIIECTKLIMEDINNG